MDEPSNSRLRSVPLDRLRSAFARASPRDPVPPDAAIDLSRPFLPPSVGLVAGVAGGVLLGRPRKAAA